MYKVELRAQIDQDGLHFDKEYLTSKLEWGDYVISITKEGNLKTIDEYRAEYFAKRDILASDTGNSKKEIHEEAKRRFLENGSTKTLNEEEWKEFINKFKEWGYEHFNCYL